MAKNPKCVVGDQGVGRNFRAFNEAERCKIKLENEMKAPLHIRGHGPSQTPSYVEFSVAKYDSNYSCSEGVLFPGSFVFDQKFESESCAASLTRITGISHVAQKIPHLFLDDFKIVKKSK